MSEKTIKILVSERALFARVHRALAKEGRAIKRCKMKSRSYNELGDYYTVETPSGKIDTMKINLVKISKELGLLRPYEKAEL